MSIHLESAELIVDGVQRKSRARYAQGIKPGDTIVLTLDTSYTRGASNRGSYAQYFGMYVNGKFVASLSENEVPRLEDIFLLRATSNEKPEQE